MNFNKLSKYFSGKFPNSEKINISEFIQILGNLDIEGDFISEYSIKFGSIKTDYDLLFQKIYESENGETKIYNILNYFELSKSFLEVIDYSGVSEDLLNNSFDNLDNIKQNFLIEFNLVLNKLNSNEKNNKLNGNIFEEISEKFLLNSTYFDAGLKEFSFEDGTEKIDRLLRLKKDIGNFGKSTNYLGYAILEAKFKKKTKGKKQEQNSSGEVSQIKDYIERLNNYGISKYAIVITSSNFKDTYKTKIGDYCRKKVIDSNPFYLSLITVEEILEFLENKGMYENMSFDEFIERSFIKWLK